MASRSHGPVLDAQPLLAAYCVSRILSVMPIPYIPRTRARNAAARNTEIQNGREAAGRRGWWWGGGGERRPRPTAAPAR